MNDYISNRRPTQHQAGEYVNRSGAPARVEKLDGRLVFDPHGNPAVRVRIVLDDTSEHTASASSTTIGRALGDAMTAEEFIECEATTSLIAHRIAPAVESQTWTSQALVDASILSVLDERPGPLAAAVGRATSIAMARALAHVHERALNEHIASIAGIAPSIPRPLMTLVTLARDIAPDAHWRTVALLAAVDDGVDTALAHAVAAWGKLVQRFLDDAPAVQYAADGSLVVVDDDLNFQLERITACADDAGLQLQPNASRLLVHAEHHNGVDENAAVIVGDFPAADPISDASQPLAAQWTPVELSTQPTVSQLVADAMRIASPRPLTLVGADTGMDDEFAAAFASGVGAGAVGWGAPSGLRLPMYDQLLGLTGTICAPSRLGTAAAGA